MICADPAEPGEKNVARNQPAPGARLDRGQTVIGRRAFPSGCETTSATSFIGDIPALRGAAARSSPRRARRWSRGRSARLGPTRSPAGSARAAGCRPPARAVSRKKALRCRSPPVAPGVTGSAVKIGVRGALGRASGRPAGCARSCNSLKLAELDRVGRARFGAGRLEAALQPVIAERAFVRLAVLEAEIDDAERAGRHAIAAAVADVLLHDDGVELGAEERAGRAGFQAGRVASNACRRRSSSASCSGTAAFPSPARRPARSAR